MTNSESLQAKTFDTVIVGNGPAAIGAFVAAARTGSLKAFLDGGVAVIGNSPRIGSGKLGTYKIRSNSPAGDFLEPFDKSQDHEFDEVLDGQEAQTLRDDADNISPLETIGRFIDRVGERVYQLLEEHPSCCFIHGSADAIEIGNDGKNKIVTNEGVINARSIILATGGRQSVDSSNGTLSADECLSNPDVLNDALQNGAQINILGGSHSAFSVAHTIVQKAGQTRNDILIRVLHRSPIRLFYDLEKESAPDWYEYDAKADVCPQTNRLHRFGGLRGDARELFLRILNEEEEHVILEVAAPQNLPQAGTTIDATGYEANLIPITDNKGEAIPLHVVNDKQVNVDENGQIKTTNGEIVPNIYGIGLGYGIYPNGVGEPSFNGRLDGVNIYWGPVGESIVRSILERRAQSATTLSSHS